MTGTKTNERPGTRAQVRYLRMSASKARVVLDLIRDKSVAEATQILTFSERLASEHILKLLNSAIANAGHNDDIPAEELYVSACYADEGPTLKRFRPRARGRAGRINKRTCHITIVVSRLSDDELERQRNRAERRGGASSDAAASRRRRVASSRGEDASASDATEDSDTSEDSVTAEAETVEAEATEVQATDVETADVETADAETAEAVDAPYGDGSHGLVDGDASIMPEGYPVKGNKDSMLYHNPDSPHYARTGAEVWFASDEAAEAAGFSKPGLQADAEEAADDSEGDA